MRATEANLLEFIHGNLQFQVPIYQRRYDWGEEECEKLWAAVLDAGEDKSIRSYFLGSIVYIKKDNHHASTRIRTFYLIDGQQRLATISLLLAALGEAIEDGSVEIGITQEEIKNDYLFNTSKTDEYHYKQLLTEPDKETLNRLLDDRPLPSNSSERLLENYRFFKEKLQPQNLKAVYEGIHKLEIVDVLLDHEKQDDPQLIFETINSTGTQLTDADLIRNYIFMRQTDGFQKRLYEDYWRPMEQRFGQDYAEPLSLFIADYIMLKKGESVTKADVYKKFKEAVPNKDEGALRESIKEICRYSEHYVCFAPLKEEDDQIQEKDPELRERFESFNEFQVTTVFPLLLSLYEDYKKKRLQKTEIIEVLRLIENYIVRRLICVRSGTKHARKVFLKLMSDIDKSDHIESLKKAFAKQTAQARYYSDAEFKEHFCDVDVYGQRSCHYLLYRLENYGHPQEQIPLKDCTKERVMPQTMTEEWRKELGEDWEQVHSKYLNKIGNLTLTGHNSKLSNKPFKKKKEILRDSPLSLNQYIVQRKRWNEATITSRAKDLSEKALKIWPDHGKVIQETEEQQKKDWTLADHPHLTGEMMELFKQLRRGVRQLDDSVSERIRKLYIAYGMNPTLVTVYPQTKRLRLLLNLPFSDINDPRQECTDLTHMNHHQLGDVEVGVSSVDELDYIMFLIRQVFEKQSERL